MKCVKCNKEAEYIVDGQSVCKDHKEDKEEEGIGEEVSMGDRLAGDIQR